MRHFFLGLMAYTCMCASPAQAGDTPVQNFIPLSAARTASNVKTVNAMPHFFPLAGRPMGKLIPHASPATKAEEADIPTPNANTKTEAMTHDDAQAILSIFGKEE